MAQPNAQKQWSDFPVSSWNDLLRELHSSTIVPTHTLQGGHRRSPYVFRGMSDASWALQTSLERLKSRPDAVEEPLLRAFGKYAPTGAIARQSEWERLAVA